MEKENFPFNRIMHGGGIYPGENARYSHNLLHHRNWLAKKTTTTNIKGTTTDMELFRNVTQKFQTVPKREACSAIRNQTHNYFPWHPSKILQLTVTVGLVSRQRESELNGKWWMRLRLLYFKTELLIFVRICLTAIREHTRMHTQTLRIQTPKHGKNVDLHFMLMRSNHKWRLQQTSIPNRELPYMIYDKIKLVPYLRGLYL